MRLLITGGCGFLGSNLAAHALTLDHIERVAILDDLSRVGSKENLAWLRSLGEFEFEQVDIRRFEMVERVVESFTPNVVFHLAGQVAMTTSVADPRRDFEINVVGGHNVIESVRRHAPDALVTFSSSNKVYGGLGDLRLEEHSTRWVAPDYPLGFDENTPLDFRTPYGCSKGAVDQYFLDYARIFDVATVVFRHSSVFGGRQFSTYDQGWIGWFAAEALRLKSGDSRPVALSGDGKQVRDVLFVRDLVDCYFDAVAQREMCAGQAFNIGGGPENSLSLLELFSLFKELVGVAIEPVFLPWRQEDQKVYISDIRKAHDIFGWSPTVSVLDGVKETISWVEANA